MFDEVLDLAAIYIGDLYLSNKALALVVILVLGLVAVLIFGISYIIN